MSGTHEMVDGMMLDLEARGLISLECEKCEGKGFIPEPVRYGDDVDVEIFHCPVCKGTGKLITEADAKRVYPYAMGRRSGKTLSSQAIIEHYPSGYDDIKSPNAAFCCNCHRFIPHSRIRTHMGKRRYVFICHWPPCVVKRIYHNLRIWIATLGR